MQKLFGCVSRYAGSEPVCTEDDMGALVVLGQFFIGVGVLLLGVAAIWFVSVYSGRKD
jgi:hypothetical protein